MTSEILIMNKDCVAMAADSAATLNIQKPKIFETNKVFALSKECPVGLMIYQNPSISGVPVETLVKEFRKYVLPANGYATIEEYGDKFLEFVEKGYPTRSKRKRVPIITEDAVSSNMRFCFYRLWEQLIDIMNLQISNFVHEQMNDDRIAIDVSPKTILDTAVRKQMEKASLNRREINKTDRDEIKKEIDAVCEMEQFAETMDEISYPIDYSEYIDRLKEIMLATICSEDPLESTTGIIIAGFGENQTYPAYIEYNVDGCFGKKLKYLKIESDEITDDRSAIIKTFAQGDVASTFLDGIAPELMRRIFERVEGIFSKEFRSKKADGTKDDDISKIASALAISDLRNDVDEWIENDYYGPIRETIRFLSKREMAQMAESMINLTTLRRRMSLFSVENVGGPVDVAIISKGDGLIWINRKHYFEMSKNPHYDVKG